MTQRRALIKQISRAAKAMDLTWEVAREGANHTVYSLDGVMIPIPRHREIGEGLTDEIRKQAGAKLGKGWWR